MENLLKVILCLVICPVRLLVIDFRRGQYCELTCQARNRQWKKNHERMHWMSGVTNTAYTESELYKDMYKNAPELR